MTSYSKVREYGEPLNPTGGQYRCEKCSEAKTWLKDLVQCPNCGRWVCQSDWASNEGSCTLCSAELTTKFALAEKLTVQVEELGKMLAAKEAELTEVKSRAPIAPRTSVSEGILRKGVYVSYAVGSELERIVERKVRRLLEALDLSVITSKKDPSVTRDLPTALKNSDLVVALLTKDVKREEEGKVIWNPTHYVVDDAKAATGKKVILMVEQGVEYPQEIMRGAHVIEFRRDDPAEMIVDLTAILRRVELPQRA